MKLSVIIPTRDRGAVFDQTLGCAVDAIKHLDAEIIAVNDSTIASPSLPVATSGIRLMQNNGRGVAAARNLGAKEATGEMLLFLDDDVLITRASLAHTLTVHSQHPGIALNPDWTYPPEQIKSLHRTAFGRFLLARNLTTFKGWYSHPGWQENALFESASVASFHLSVLRADFIKSGGYDEKFPFAGFEDYDFPLRLKDAGVKFRIDTRIAVYHNEADRLILPAWLDSQERRSVTRAVAVHRGYRHLAIQYSASKKLLLTMLLGVYRVALGVLQNIPNVGWLDRLAFAGIGYLQAAKIYRGYLRGLKR